MKQIWELLIISNVIILYVVILRVVWMLMRRIMLLYFFLLLLINHLLIDVWIYIVLLLILVKVIGHVFVLTSWLHFHKLIHQINWFSLWHIFFIIIIIIHLVISIFNRHLLYFKQYLKLRVFLHFFKFINLIFDLFLISQF